MTRVIGLLIAAVGLLGQAAAAGAPPRDADLAAVAALTGEPHSVSAAGVTRAETLLSTLENRSPFDPGAPALRLVIVGGLDGDPRSAESVLAAVRWMKTDAPPEIRERWVVSALP